MVLLVLFGKVLMEVLFKYFISSAWKTIKHVFLCCLGVNWQVMLYTQEYSFQTIDCPSVTVCFAVGFADSNQVRT